LTKIEASTEDFVPGEDQQGFSAADYDPTKDRIADDERQLHHKSVKDLELLKNKDAQESVVQNDDVDMFSADYKETLNERNGIHHNNNIKSNDEFDMFADDDMFAPSTESKKPIQSIPVSNFILNIFIKFNPVIYYICYPLNRLLRLFL